MSAVGIAKRLGELLVERGLLKEWQLKLALEEQRTNHEFLGALLVRKAWVAQDALLRTLAEQFRVPYVRLADEAIDWTIAKRFSPALLQEHHCVPLRMDEEAVTIAVSNPLDAWVISELERQAGLRKIRIVLALQQDIDAALHRCQQEAFRAADDRLKGRAT